MPPLIAVVPPASVVSDTRVTVPPTGAPKLTVPLLFTNSSAGPSTAPVKLIFPAVAARVTSPVPSVIIPEKVLLPPVLTSAPAPL